MKVGVFTTNESFIGPVLEALQKRGHEVLYWTHTPDEHVNWMNLSRLIDRCDLAFFDWCQKPFLEAMSLEEIKCKVAVRAHGMPFFDIWDSFPWNHVDLLIGASVIIGWKIDKLPPERRPRKYLHSPVGSDPTLFQIPKNKRYGRHIVTHSTTIRYRKRVYTTIQSFYDLLQLDRKWELSIVGEWEKGYSGWEGRQYTDPCLELMEDLDLMTKVRRLPNMDQETWRAFLGGQDIFVSNSIREGVQVSLVDAMLSGVYPLINCWRGAEHYYPRECIFRTQRELVDKIRAWLKLPLEEKRRLSQEMREWASERFDSSVNTAKLVEELEALGG